MAKATNITKGTKKPNAQWPAQFLVAAELARNGYVVSFTMGNTPNADLMVGKPDGTSMFWVDVKGLGKEKKYFLVKEKLPHECLYYVLVRVGKKLGDDEFAVLTQDQFNELIKAQKALDLSKGNVPLSGFGWPACQRFQDKWSVLPGWLSS